MEQALTGGPMKLYGHVNRKSPHSFKVQVALAEARVAYDYIAVDVTGSGSQAPEFLNVNSHGKLPVLVDDGFTLADSNAILWYVAERFPDAELLPPAGDATAAAVRQRARTLQWCDFASTAVYPAYADVYLHTAAQAVEKGNSAVADAAMQRFLRAIAVMASVVGAQPFMAGRYSIADIGLASIIQTAKVHLSEEPVNHPAISAWLTRVTKRPAWQNALTAA